MLFWILGKSSTQPKSGTDQNCVVTNTFEHAIGSGSRRAKSPSNFDCYYAWTRSVSIFCPRNWPKKVWNWCFKFQSARWVNEIFFRLSTGGIQFGIRNLWHWWNALAKIYVKYARHICIWELASGRGFLNNGNQQTAPIDWWGALFSLRDINQALRAIFRL